MAYGDAPEWFRAASEFPRPWLEAQNGLLPFFGGLLETPVLRRHGPSIGFLFRGYSPCRCLRDGYRIWVCRLRFFGSSCPISPTTLSLLRYFLRTTTAMAKQKITGGELSARAKANGYQRGVYRDKDSLRDHRECYVSNG